MQILRQSNLLFLLISTLFIGGSVFAAPTVDGPSGLIRVPTAEALKYKEIGFAYDYTLSSIDPANDTYDYKINLGTFRGWELGITGGKVPTEGVYVNAKYYLLSDNTRYPLSIAVGFQNLASQTNTALYLVASQKFQGGIYGHFGFKADFTQETIESAVMGGIEYFWSEQFAIVSDLIGGNNIYSANVGFRYYVLPELLLRVSLLDVSKSLSEDTPVVLGLSVNKFL